MGRKKIQIQRITDERNKQVSICLFLKNMPWLKKKNNNMTLCILKQFCHLNMFEKHGLNVEEKGSKIKQISA